MVNKALRIVLYTIFTISLLFVVPFNNIYASVQSQIVPTFSSSTSQWNGHLWVTNFSDGTNNQASSTLQFTLDDDYYGMIYFDGYGPSNQHIANYAVCFVAGGQGEYRYSYYQNGVINITQITIQSVSVVKPETTVDLTQIIQLLTAIENDTNSIDNLMDSTLTAIRSVLSQLVVSNGYLEQLTKLKQWNVPAESLTFVSQYFQYDYELIFLDDYNYFNYPMFKVPANSSIKSLWANYLADNSNQVLIFGINQNLYDQTTLNNLFTLDNISIKSFETIYRKDIPYGAGQQLSIVKIVFNVASETRYGYFRFNGEYGFIPIFFEYVNSSKNVSTDFALLYGLSNRLLDDLNLIANGTNASSAASSQSDQANSQLQQDSNTLFTQEDSFKQNMNSAMQNIDTTFSLNNFGSSFMTSAQWVRTQYETLTNNTPFASLITFSLLVGLALIVIGKVYK